MIKCECGYTGESTDVRAHKARMAAKGVTCYDRTDYVYVAKRVELIPAAEQYADQNCGNDKWRWDRLFHAKMEELWRERNAKPSQI